MRTVDGLASHGRIESRTEGVLTEHAYIERIAFGGCGPPDESSKVVQIDCLHAILGGLGILRPQSRDANQRPCEGYRREQGGMCQFRHVIATYTPRLMPTS